MCYYELKEEGGKLSVLIDFMKYGRKKKLGTIAFLDFCPLYKHYSKYIYFECTLFEQPTWFYIN